MKGSEHSQLIAQFPIFTQSDTPVAFLDNASSSQKPQRVIDRVRDFYANEYANVHRGLYRLSENATAAYESTRHDVAQWIGAQRAEEVVFVRGTTEGINLVASSWCQENLKPGDEIVLTILEHHSNIVPWQLAAERVGAKIRFIPLGDDLRLDMKVAKEMIQDKTKVVAFSHVSNVLGTLQPVAELIELAKSVGAMTLVDGAQATPHLAVDVEALGCDFYVFSGHKMLGPMGIGVLWGRYDVLEKMPPFLGGGDMIESVTVSGSTWQKPPHRFEAGTPNAGGVLGLGEAIRVLGELDREQLLAHEKEVARYALDGLSRFPKVKVFVRDTEDWLGVVSFLHESIHSHDIAAVMDASGVCLRAGHHCAQPLMGALGVGSTSRISPYIYNTTKDIDRFLEAMAKAEDLFGS